MATKDQLSAALALIELDGIARRLVLCPSDLPVQHLPFVIESAGVEAVVCDQLILGEKFPSIGCHVVCSANLISAICDRSISHETEWILLTSGTTGVPKLVAHTLRSLSGAIQPIGESARPIVWGTFYDIRRYGGLQIFLRAVLTGSSLVLTSSDEPTADYLARAGALGVTHISGTPSHWRRELMSSSAHLIAPQYIRLSGEIVDQGILNRLRSFYPDAKIKHAFASTEAGLGFEVNDGLAGFPASYLGQRSDDVELRIQDGSLRIRSACTANRYMDTNDKLLRDGGGFVDTGDMVELRGDRYYFVGRRDGVINVGGLKVHPEEVEMVINRHPQVRMSVVRTRKNPITGALVVADIVLEKDGESQKGRVNEVQHEILQLCRSELPRYKIPTTINIVPALKVSATGKMVRTRA